MNQSDETVPIEYASQADRPTGGIVPLKYPPPAAAISGRLGLRALTYFGPGAIIASVTIGSGETLFASRAGAIFGYSLGWFIALCALTKAIQVYTAARYLTLTGEHPMESWARLPGLRGWFPWFMSVLSIFCFPFWLAGLPLMLGTLLNHLGGVSPDDPQYLYYARLWGTGCILIAITLTVIQPYSVFEKVQTGIVAILLLSILIGVFASPADWFAVLRGIFVFEIPKFEGWFETKYAEDAQSLTAIVVMVTFMGAIGGGTYDYIGYLGFYREKDWGALGLQNDPDAQATLDAMQDEKIRSLSMEDSEQNRKNAKAWLRAPLIDVGVSFLAVLLFTYAFTILGAAVLHPKEIVPAGLNLLTEQVRFLTQFGEKFKYVYYTGVIMAFWGTIYGGYEIYVRTGYECLRSVSRKLRHTPVSKVKPWILLYCGVGAMTLMWTLDKPTDLVKPAAILGGAFLCGVWCFAMIYADRRFLPKFLQMSIWLMLLNVISGTALCAFGGMAMYDYLTPKLSAMYGYFVALFS